MSASPSRHSPARPDDATDGRRLPRGLLGGLALAALLAGGCSHTPPPKDAKAIQVSVTTPITAAVTDYQDFTGRLNAVYNVEIRARVTGYVKAANFKEGDLVEEGTVLFEIDPRSYQADLNLAKANLKLAEAERNVQETIANRSQRLVKTKAVAQEDFDTIQATLEKDKATVEAMEAARDKAKLYKDWTRVTAPIGGRVSRRLVDPGNMVTADVTPLTTVVTEDVMYVYFDVDERTYLDLLKSAAPGLLTPVVAPPRKDAETGKPKAGKKGSPAPSLAQQFTGARVAGLKFPILMRLANEEKFTHVGTVDFVDNQINGTTGTIRMRGLFRNTSGILKPGLFARVRLPTSRPSRAILVPDEALMSDQGRKYVFVVNKQKNDKDEDRAEYRRVTPGQVVMAWKKEKDANGKDQLVEYPLRVIQRPPADKKSEEGIAEGERVIVINQQRVRTGMPVTVKNQPPPERPESPFGDLLTMAQPPEGNHGRHGEHGKKTEKE